MKKSKLFTTPTKDLTRKQLCELLVLLAFNITDAENIIAKLITKVSIGYYGKTRNDDLILQIAYIKQSLNKTY